MMNVLSRLFQGPPIIVSYAPNSKVIADQSIQCSALIHDATYGSINTEGMIPFVNGQELTLHEISSYDEGTSRVRCYCASQNGTKSWIKVFVIGGFFFFISLNQLFSSPEKGAVCRLKELFEPTIIEPMKLVEVRINSFTHNAT